MAMSSKEINNAYVVDKDGMLLGEIKFVDLAVFSLENTKSKMQKTDLNKCIIPISKSVKDNLITTKNTLYTDVELIGVCTGICVISNAITIKAVNPEIKITVDSRCCACVTPESHKSALETMKMCQINVV